MPFSFIQIITVLPSNLIIEVRITTSAMNLMWSSARAKVQNLQIEGKVGRTVREGKNAIENGQGVSLRRPLCVIMNLALEKLTK